MQVRLLQVGPASESSKSLADVEGTAGGRRHKEGWSLGRQE